MNNTCALFRLGVDVITEGRPYLVLGLDPGIASCGFCLLDLANHRILEMGSHLFDTPQEAKTKTSLAVKRRNARSVRRNTKRTRDRQTHCLRLLIAYGLVPEGAGKTWLQSKKGDKPMLKLRARALDMVLTNRQLAQVLYSLSARRGYIPHGEGGIDSLDDVEGKKVLYSINANTAAMQNGGFRTVGEMLNSAGSSRNKGGKYENCVLNSQIVEEVRLIFEAQRSLGNQFASVRLESEYLKCLIWEKKTLDHDEKVYRLVGNCVYFKGEKRAAEADLSSELCRAYERLKHLVIVSEDGVESSLSMADVRRYIDVLFSPIEPKKKSEGKVTYGRIRKDLDLPDKSYFKGIDPDGAEGEEVFAPKAWRLMRRAGLPKELLGRMLADRNLADMIGEALTYASTEDSLRKQLETLDLDEEDIAAMCRLPFAGKIFKGYGNRSLKALNILLEMMAESDVHTLAEAEEASGLKDLRLSDRFERSTFLPPYVAYDSTCNNPVVLRALGRMRRIVNAIIRIHGVPDEIHIELDRDLKRSNKEKALVTKRNRENRARNERLSNMAGELLGVSPDEVSGKVIRKLVLWEEQGNFDVYTNKAIDLERLLTDSHYCEIDHILPYSRTCDDSWNNKVLVLTSSNQDKHERTPYEWMTSGEPSAPNWEDFKAHVLSTPKLFPKRKYLLNSSLGPDEQREFLDRNLNDTRYMSRAVKAYIEDTLLFPENGKEKHVIAVSGGATGSLRYVWGIPKDRTDDRHHAVDAAVIAACSEATVQKVARASSLGKDYYKRHRKSRLSDTQPWPSFTTDVLTAKESVIPTRMVSHGVTGRAFEDMAYGFEGTTDDAKRLSILHRKDGGVLKHYKKGNVVVDGAGAARLVDGMAFLRLWLDPSARPNGRTPGKYYAEPVYYADLPAIRNGSYTPKAMSAKVARTAWKPLPEAAMQRIPIVLFRGDVLSVNGVMGRFWRIDIFGGKIEVRDVRTGCKLEGFPTINSWGKDTVVKVIEEDCLGHCYKGLKPSSGEGLES